MALVRMCDQASMARPLATRRVVRECAQCLCQSDSDFFAASSTVGQPAEELRLTLLQQLHQTVQTLQHTVHAIQQARHWFT